MDAGVGNLRAHVGTGLHDQSRNRDGSEAHQPGRDGLQTGASETLHHAELDPLQQQQINQVLQPRPGLRKRTEALAMTVEEHRKLALESLRRWQNVEALAIGCFAYRFGSEGFHWISRESLCLDANKFYVLL
ncbi:unnamed protein product [Symbiodinium necroappetens]|uniref:Uncharacterized protein n=1 Tax=Symbiodinium necroappetens TaxID=1628268 RepID=A0A813A4P6_9DINO|nr:unnamed protein product [Symbiodinium necroappetens]